MTNFQTAQIFGDNMVLQFQKPVSVFGTGTDGTKITVSISGMEAATNSTVVHNGRWLVMLPPQPAQDSVELTVSDGSESRTFTNVAVGAVWLAGGQSNMELELRNCSTGKDSLENDDTPNVRFYYTMKKTIADDSFFESEKQMVWNDFSNKESAQYWSAVGYYFAKELSERLGMTVGIIGCNWGGSSASAWTKREYADGETAVYFEDYDSATAGKSEQQLKQDYLDYQAYHNEWERKSAEYGHPIYIIADEPYRELVYDNTEVPYIPGIYRDTVICYSYSKSLSMPGERIGYVCIPDSVTDSAKLHAAVAGASRAFGHVCAPSMMQRVIARATGLRPDLEAYDKNRHTLYNALSEMGYECVKPEGAFYMMVKAPGGDAHAFSERAKKENLLLVPADSFGCPGFFRISTCVDPAMIQRSLPAFRRVLQD